MSPFSLSSFWGVQRILGYVRPRRIVAVHPPKRGKRRPHLWVAFGGAFELGQPSHCDVIGLQMQPQMQMQTLNWDIANALTRGTSQVSYLIFPPSLLDPEVTLFRHLAHASALRSEQGSLWTRIHEISHSPHIRYIWMRWHHSVTPQRKGISLLFHPLFAWFPLHAPFVGGTWTQGRRTTWMQFKWLGMNKWM